MCKKCSASHDVRTKNHDVLSVDELSKSQMKTNLSTMSMAKRPNVIVKHAENFAAETA